MKTILSIIKSELMQRLSSLGNTDFLSHARISGHLVH